MTAGDRTLCLMLTADLPTGEGGDLTRARLRTGGGEELRDMLLETVLLVRATCLLGGGDSEAELSRCGLRPQLPE